MPEDGRSLGCCIQCTWLQVFSVSQNYVCLVFSAPTAPPENFTLQVVGSRAILVSWRLPLFGERNGVIISYTIVLVELTTNTTLIYQREGNHTELIVEELHPYYQYRCSIVAATQVGASPSSDFVTIRTGEDGKANERTFTV